MEQLSFVDTVSTAYFLFVDTVSTAQFLEARASLEPGLTVTPSLGPSRFSSPTCQINNNEQECLGGYQIGQNHYQNGLDIQRVGQDGYKDGQNWFKDGQYCPYKDLKSGKDSQVKFQHNNYSNKQYCQDGNLIDQEYHQNGFDSHQDSQIGLRM